MQKIFSILFLLFFFGIVTCIPATAITDDWKIIGDIVYTNNSKVYLAASPHTVQEAGYVYFTLTSKLYSGDVDVYFGFNSGGMKPLSAEYYKNGEWVSIGSHFSKETYQYDNLDVWYYAQNMPVTAGTPYVIRVYMEPQNDISFGKYGYAIKPSSLTISQAISQGKFYYLDPWWNSSWKAISKINLNTSTTTPEYQVHLSSDDFSIPAKMWTGMNKDGNDTRFLSTNNSTVFPYWVEHLTAADNYSIWVNVTQNNTSEILWYYYNPNATSESSHDDTFIIYDDFDDYTGSDETEHGRWTSDIVGNGLVDITSNRLRAFSGNAAGHRGYANSTKTYGNNTIIEGRALIWGGGGGNNEFIGDVYGVSPVGDDYITFLDLSVTNDYIWMNSKKDGTAGTATTYTGDNNYHTYKVIYEETKIRWYVDDVLKKTQTDTSVIPIDPMHLFLGAVYATATEFSYLETVSVRKYSATPPIINNITLLNVANDPPTVPTVNAPTGAYVTSYPPVVLDVISTDVDNDTITYYFYGDTVNGSTFLGNNDTVGGNTYNWSISAIDVYYWKARAYDGYNFSAYTSVHQFTLFPPPELTTPANASTTNTTYPPLTDDVTFVWEDTGAPQYRLVVATDSFFNVIYLDTYVATNTSTQSLIVNDLYYWRVYSYDGSTYSETSEIFQFTLNGNSSLSGPAIEGVVYGGDPGAYVALQNAQVYITNGSWSGYATTGSTGYYRFIGLKEGTIYTLQASKDEYLTSQLVYVNTTSDPTIKNFYLVVDRTSQEWWHYVRFVVKSLWGTRYANVAVSVYDGDDVTPSFTGITGNDGAVTFHLYQQTEYRITFINATQGISKTLTLYPKDDDYYVYVTASKQEWKEHDIPVRDGLDFSVTKKIINATHAYVNVTYNDTLSQTTGIIVYLNQSNSSDPNNQSVIDSYSSSGNVTHSFIVSGYLGQSYFVHFDITHTTYGNVDKMFSVAFKKTLADEWPGIPKAAWVYGSIFVIIFIGATFASSHVEIGAVVMGTMAWTFYLWGLWDPLPGNVEDKMVLGATLLIVLGILEYVNKKSKEEGYS